MNLGLSLSLTSAALRQGGGVPSFPMRGEDGSLPSLDFNAASDQYYWGGVEHPRSDLVTVAGSPTWDAEGLLVDGTDRIKLPDASIASWFNWDEGTLYVEWFRENNSARGYLFSMRGGSGGTAVRVDVAINADRRAELALIDGALGNPNGYYSANTAQSATWPRTNRGRAVMGYKIGEKPRLADRGVLLIPTGPDQAALIGISPTEAVLGYFRSTNLDQLNGYVKRVVFWPKKFSDAWITALSAKSAKSLHLLGDSFSPVTYLAPAVNANPGNDDRVFSVDSVGGSYLRAQAARFAGGTVELAATGNSQTGAVNNGNGTFTYPGTPQFRDRTLVIMDGALEEDAATSIAAIQKMVAYLTHDRWLYVESSPAENILGSPARIDLDAKKAAIRAYVGETRYVETLNRALTLGDGSANDNADIANGIWPRSLRVDTIHPTDTAWASVIWFQISAKLAANGW